MTEGRTTTFHVRTRSARWGATVGKGDLGAWIERGWVDDAVEVSPDGKAWHAVGRHPAFASAFERAEPVRKAAGALDRVVAAAGGSRDSAPRGPNAGASGKAPSMVRRVPASVKMLVLLGIVAVALVATAVNLQSTAREARSPRPPANPVRAASSDVGTAVTALPSASGKPAEQSVTDGVTPEQRAEAVRLGVPVAYEDAVTGIRFVLVPGGSFLMGSPENQLGRFVDEGPQHRVTLPPFYLSVHEVTNAQYRRKDASRPPAKGGDTHPVTQVSWDEAVSYANWISALGPVSGYTLPTEAQWEYACRAGSTTRFSFGDDASLLGQYSWCGDDSGGITHPVGTKHPNRWGLYDMHGNAWEWCADNWHPTYAGAPADGSSWVSGPATDRVVRGIWSCSRRDRCAPEGLPLLGFRLARAIRGGATSTSAVPSTAPSASRAPPAQTAPSLLPPPDWAQVAPEQLKEAARLGVPVAYEDATTGMRFVLVPGGSFMMGSSRGDQFREVNEWPQHEVTIRTFYLAVHEVTNAQYRIKVPRHRSASNDEAHPVTDVNFLDASSYAEWLSTKAGVQAYELPSEAQWEYACRAASRTAWSFGSDSSRLREFAWFRDNSRNEARPVALKLPNRWGLYDMHGNVWEWCGDGYHNSYVGAPADGRAWLDSSSDPYRVIRGGSWFSSEFGVRSAQREGGLAGSSGGSLGFRLARTIVSLER